MSDFDLNLIRAAVTVLSFATFLGIVAWALSRRNQAAFDLAAQQPFVGDRDATGSSGERSTNQAKESGDE